VNRSYPERYTVATVRQHGVERSGGLKTAELKTPKGGQREPPVPGRDAGQAGLKNFQSAGDVQNTPLACERKAI
jgi:hypothetical protein